MNSFDQLRQITDVLYLKEQKAIQSILAEEARIRQEIAKLDQQVREARTNDGTEAMKPIGADVIWLAWVGRTKASLNIQLAQVLARKENSIGRLRHAFGKKMVAAQLSEDSKAQQKLEFDKKALEAAIDLTLGK